MTKVFKQPQVNNTDTVTSRGNIAGIGASSSGITTKNQIVKPQESNQNVGSTPLLFDSLSTPQSFHKTLFTVPYRCTLNRDSLKAEARKVILEIDTIPKGLNTIVSENLLDTTYQKPVEFTESLFSPHLLSTKKIEPIPKVAMEQNWIVYVFVLILFLAAILRVFYQKKFTLFINAFISRRFSNQILREENALTQSTSILLSAIFFISASLFFYLVSKYFHQNISGYSEWQSFLLILLACVGFYFLKLFINKVGGYIFKTYKETEEYIFNQFLVLQILGLLLIIWSILLKFSTNINKEIFIYAGFSTLLLGFIIRMVKSFGIVNMNTYSPVYIFLYLCTLEILPLIIIVKLIIR